MAMSWYGEEAMAEVRRRADEAAAAIARDLLETAQAEAPSRTGELRDSGRVVDAGPGHRRVEFTAPHAAAIELGSQARGPNAFLRRSCVIVARRATGWLGSTRW